MTTTANGMTISSTESSNVLQRFEGVEHALQLGEGTYFLRDDLQLATPPLHPSEVPLNNPNPLATTPTPPTSSVKLSMTILNRSKSQFYHALPGLSGSFEKFNLSSEDGGGDGGPSTETGSEDAQHSTSLENGSFGTPAFGQGNAALAPTPSKEPLKRRKPKNNIIKSNSSFVSRVIPHDSLAKRLTERDPGGALAFANLNRAFQWLDLSSSQKSEPLAKILFTKAHMLCHDVNHLTKSSSHIDVIMGSSAGDIIWYEPMSQKYARINKNGSINNTPVSYIKWIPGSENLFLASHMDGTLVVYDKEKEDSAFSTEELTLPRESTRNEGPDLHLDVVKSVNSSNQKLNPVACWNVARYAVNQFAFSPDCRHLAVVSEDGHLRIIDYLQEKLTDVFSSYYGGFTCVCWSPDGTYILTGGQDDLVSIWSFPDRQIVARCQGHDSWVTSVAFDPWRCGDRNYRFGSVGEDCKLLLWDFSVGMLHRPRGATVRQRGSISVQSLSLQRNRTGSTITANRLGSDSGKTQNPQQEMNGHQEDTINHDIEPRSRTAHFPPVMTKAVDDHPLCWLGFEEDCIITSCQEGHIRTWDRPKEGVNGSQIALSGGPPG